MYSSRLLPPPVVITDCAETPFSSSAYLSAEELKKGVLYFFARAKIFSAVAKSGASEFDRKREFSEQLLAGAFEQICIYLIRAFKKTPPSDRGDVTRAETLCFQLMHYIDTHVYSLKTLDDLSGIFGYNYSYLSALFKKVTSETLAGYFRNRRLETARLLLNEGKLNITKIAELLNYSSIYSFSKAFKEKYGVSPKFGH